MSWPLLFAFSLYKQDNGTLGFQMLLGRTVSIMSWVFCLSSFIFPFETDKMFLPNLGVGVALLVMVAQVYNKN